MSHKRYCKILPYTAPGIMVYQSPPEDDIVLDDGTEVDDASVIIQQEEYLAQILENGITYTPIFGEFSVGELDARPTWNEYIIDVTSILEFNGTGRIIDFSFTRKPNEYAENAFVKKVLLTMITDSGTIEVPFLFSTARFVECADKIHPISSSGQDVHTYEFVPETVDLISASLSFEVSDDWYCAECCGDGFGGVEIDVSIGVEVLP